MRLMKTPTALVLSRLGECINPEEAAKLTGLGFWYALVQLHELGTREPGCVEAVFHNSYDAKKMASELTRIHGGTEANVGSFYAVVNLDPKEIWHG